MKHEIIKTENYLLVVDESEMKEGDWCTSHLNVIDESKIHNSCMLFNPQNQEHFDMVKSCKKIIAHLPLNGSPILEGVDLLPPLQDDTMGVPLVQYIFEKHNQDRVMGFCDGYKKAKERYKYTDEDIIKLADVHREDGYPPIIFEWLIQSLSQPKMPIGFECEIEDKIALDGHTIIGVEPKTTTTPEGHTQWVGTYIFN